MKVEGKTRPVWTGAIAFGLVNIPVKLFTAVSESGLDLDMLDKKDQSPIHYKRVNEKTGKEVTWGDIVKGYKIDDHYVVLEDEDFEQAAAERSKRIDIISFVDEAELDPIYYDTSYYLEPDAKADKPYALLRNAMDKSGVIATGSFVMRNKEWLCVLKVMGPMLVLFRIHFEHEIRPVDAFEIPPLSMKLSQGEMKMAQTLIESMRAPFDVSRYKDEYTDQLMALIKSKAKGRTPHAPAKKEELPDEVSSLMEQLRASLARSVSSSDSKRVRKNNTPTTRIRRKKAKTYER